mmetsp:Transcript_28559/g.64767  ORF Transcript_28559/g.64767 Transcript_28559/m.64767 type:complete len:212 (-) Transcript_28559:1172-1807(-)
MRIHEVGHHEHLLLDNVQMLVPEMLLDKLRRLEDLAGSFEWDHALILHVSLLLHAVGDVERGQQPLALSVFHLHFRRETLGLLDPFLRALNEQALPLVLLVHKVGGQHRPDISCRSFPYHLAHIVVIFSLVVAVVVNSPQVVNEEIDFLANFYILLRLDGRDYFVLRDPLFRIKSLHELEEKRKILLQSASTGGHRRASLDGEFGGGDGTG